STTRTLAPSSAQRRAVAPPMPVAPPVTIATWPSSRCIRLLFSWWHGTKFSSENGAGASPRGVPSLLHGVPRATGGGRSGGGCGVRLVRRSVEIGGRRSTHAVGHARWLRGHRVDTCRRGFHSRPGHAASSGHVAAERDRGGFAVPYRPRACISWPAR